MLLRLLKDTLRRRTRRLLATSLAVMTGASLAAALLGISLDITGQMGRELRAYGSNILASPANNDLRLEIGGMPVFAVLLALLFILVLLALAVLWRRMAAGRVPTPAQPGGMTPPPPPEPRHAPTPMSVACKNCGKNIDLTTSKRPIEVMCPSCGETQLVT